MGKQIVVFGGSGYSGRELLLTLHRHPSVRVVLASSNSEAGARTGDIHFTPHAETFERAEAGQLAFLATSAEVSADLAPRLLDKGLSVIDLSGAFRLRDAGAYQTWYGFTHPAPELLKEAHYGIPELFEMPADTRLIANPGCYATAAVLAVHPLLGLAEGPILIDGKSGATGAGRKASAALMFSEVADNVRAYRVTEHQHTPEIERVLERTVLFTPHLVPMRRGILVTAYLRAKPGVTGADLSYAAYEGQPFIRMVDRPPETQATVNSNLVEVGAYFDERTRTIIALGAIDNLVKGAAGQAIQNMNTMLGLPMEVGL